MVVGSVTGQMCIGVGLSVNLGQLISEMFLKELQMLGCELPFCQNLRLDGLRIVGLVRLVGLLGLYRIDCVAAGLVESHVMNITSIFFVRHSNLDRNGSVGGVVRERHVNGVVLAVTGSGIKNKVLIVAHGLPCGTRNGKTGGLVASFYINDSGLDLELCGFGLFGAVLLAAGGKYRRGKSY